jgi:hypothetical protein
MLTILADYIEVTALTLAIEALNRFFSAHRSLLGHPDMGLYPLMMAGKLTYTANAGAGNGKHNGKVKADGVDVKISIPAEDYEWRVVIWVTANNRYRSKRIHASMTRPNKRKAGAPMDQAT